MSYYRDVGTPHMGSMSQDTRGPTATLNTGVGRVTPAPVAPGTCPRTQGRENPYLTHREGLPKVLTTVPHASRHTAGRALLLG